MKTNEFEKVAHTTEITHDEWLKLRKAGIGGSDAGAIAGLSKWSSRFSVYLDKLSLIPDKGDSAAMRQGRDLEAYVATRFEEATGKKVRKFNYLVRSIRYPWAFADVDRVIEGENALLECKTTNVLNPTDFDGGDIPPYWYCQCQHYMAVTGCDKVYLAVIILGYRGADPNGDLKIFEIERNEEDIKL